MEKERLNYGETFCDAIDIIVSEKLKALKFDVTKVCTIISNIYKDLGRYTVQEENIKYEAYSTNKDYAVFENVDDSDDIILFNYDENITFSEVTDEREIVMMTELLKEYDNLMENVIYEDDELYLTKFTPSMYMDVHLNSLDEDNRRFVPDEVFETLEDAKETVDFLISCYDSERGPFVYAFIISYDFIFYHISCSMYHFHA